MAHFPSFADKLLTFSGSPCIIYISRIIDVKNTPYIDLLDLRDIQNIIKLTFECGYSDKFNSKLDFLLENVSIRKTDKTLVCFINEHFEAYKSFPFSLENNLIVKPYFDLSEIMNEYKKFYLIE